MDLAKFYEGMRNHGILDQIHSATLNPKAELWKTQHLLAMAQLAKAQDPGLTIDDRLGPRELFQALGTVIDLERSVILNLTELLLVLESLDPQHLRRPTWLRHRGDQTNYRAALELALFKAQERFPWRITMRAGAPASVAPSPGRPHSPLPAQSPEPPAPRRP